MSFHSIGFPIDRGSAKILLQNASVGIFGCLQEGYERPFCRITEAAEPVKRVFGELHGGDHRLSDQAFILGIEDARLSGSGFWMAAIGMKAIRLKP